MLRLVFNQTQTTFCRTCNLSQQEQKVQIYKQQALFYKKNQQKKTLGLVIFIFNPDLVLSNQTVSFYFMRSNTLRNSRHLCMNQRKMRRVSSNSNKNLIYSVHLSTTSCKTSAFSSPNSHLKSYRGAKPIKKKKTQYFKAVPAPPIGPAEIVPSRGARCFDARIRSILYPAQQCATNTRVLCNFPYLWATFTVDVRSCDNTVGVVE